MLTQGPTPDPKYELNITSFLTLLHPIHCSICGKDIIVTALSLQVIGGGRGEGERVARFEHGSFMFGIG